MPAIATLRILTALAIALLSNSTLADGLCSVCNRYIEEGQPTGTMTDGLTREERIICALCATIPERCFLCGIPAKDGRKSLTDGRHYCHRDAQTAVFSSLEIEKICRQTMARIERPFARHFTPPADSISWTIEDLTLRAEAEAEEPSRCSEPTLRYKITRQESGNHTFTLAILNGLNPDRIRSSSIHGMTHVWLTQNVNPNRRLRSSTVESFCDLITLLALEELGETREIQRIKETHTNDSQFHALLQAYKIYDLTRVLDWMCYGQQDYLVAGDDDQIRKLDPSLQPAPIAPRQIIPPGPAPKQAPTNLVLRTILGSGNRRLALVNDATLAPGETARAHLGSTEIQLKCIEIRDRSVIVQINTDPPQELSLPNTPQP